MPFCSCRLLAVAAFFYLTIPNSLLAGGPNSFDLHLFRSINNSQSSLGISIISPVDNSVWPVAIAIPTGFLAEGFVFKDRETLETGVLLSASEVLAYGLRGAIKAVVKRPRPYSELDGVHTEHLDSTDPYSFPSGHTTGAFALATMLSLCYPKAIVIVPVFAWAGLVGYGRIYFGLHYPTDVLAGMAIGAGSAILVNCYSEPLLRLTHSILGDNVTAIAVPTQDGGVASLQIRF